MKDPLKQKKLFSTHIIELQFFWYENIHYLNFEKYLYGSI